MASQSNNGTLPLSTVFTNLFRNIPRMMLTSFLFAVPTAAFFALFWFLGTLLPVTSEQARLITMLALIPSFPFYAGVVKVTAKMAAGEEKTPVCSRFFSALKENFWRFLVHGTVFYAAVVFSYVSFNMYLRLLATNAVFMGPLIITIIIILIFVFMFFYIPVMTVTFDIPMRYIYKNSFLMCYGELKHNFIALLGLFFLTVVSTTFLICCYGSPVAVIIVSAVLFAFFVPAIASFIINSAVYARMYEMLTDRSGRTSEINAKIEEKEKGRQKKGESREDYLKTVREFKLDESIPDDEYVYFNGRMVKKSVIKKLKAEAAESEEA